MTLGLTVRGNNWVSDMLRELMDVKEELVPLSGPWGGVLSPRADCYVENGTLFLKMDVPGVKKEDIAVTLEEGVLSVEAKASESRESKSRTYYVSERAAGYFKRSFNVGRKVSPEQIKATCQDGILQVSYPLTQEKKEDTTSKILIS